MLTARGEALVVAAERLLQQARAAERDGADLWMRAYVVSKARRAAVPGAR